jgi:hypothetical protein
MTWSKKIRAEQVSIDKSDIGLGNVDNTSDLNKPISTATQTALDLKANLSALPYKLRKLSTATFSGSTSRTIIDFLEIPAGVLQNGKDYIIEIFFTKSNTATSNFYIELNTANSLSGSQQYARVQGASANRTMPLSRKVWINSNNIITTPTGATNLISNVSNAFNVLDTETYAANLANPIFILATCENADTSTVSGVVRISINEL